MFCVWLEPCAKCFQELVWRTVVEPPFAFLDEEMEVLPGNAVISAQVPFRLVPEVLNAVDVVIPVCKEFRMIDPHMVEVSDIELVISAEAVGVDNAVRLHFTGNYRNQRVRLRILHRQDEDASATLQKTEHRDLARCAAATLSLPYAAEITFVDFDLAGQFRRFLGQSLRNDHTQTVVELRRGDLVYTDEQTRCSGRSPGNEVFKQPIRLNMREF